MKCDSRKIIRKLERSASAPSRWEQPGSGSTSRSCGRLHDKLQSLPTPELPSPAPARKRPAHRGSLTVLLDLSRYQIDMQFSFIKSNTAMHLQRTPTAKQPFHEIKPAPF